MGEAGIFSADDHVELIEGEILKMSPIGSRHAACVRRLDRQFNRLLGDRALVSTQNPILLNDFSEPEPDIAIVKRRDDFYGNAHPTAADVLLVVEVAETTVDYDREIKLPAYARSGIAQVWIVDLPAQTVESYGDLVAGVYRSVQSHRRGESLAPLHFPELAVEVVSILG